MNIVYASDEHYAPILAASLASLLAYANPREDLHIYVISDDISVNSRQRLTSMAADAAAHLHFLDMPDLNSLAGVTLDFKTFSLSTFARLWLGDILNHVDRVIYLDCDTIVAESLDALWHTELRPASSMGGVLDALSAHNKRTIGLDPTEPYVNAGVLLIDLHQWRAMEARDRFVKYLVQHNGRVPHNDQGVLNACLSGSITPLHPRWNVMSYCLAMNYSELAVYKRPVGYYTRADYEEAARSPAIYHATGSFLFDRPWVAASESPIASAWATAISGTPWAHDTLVQPRPAGWPISAARTLCSGPLRGATLAALGVLHATLRDRFKSQ